MNFQELQTIACDMQRIAREHGFSESEPNIDQMLLLAVGEIAEAQEELRAGRAPTEIYYNGTSSKPEGFPVEIADAIIRLLQMCPRLGIDIAHAIELKAAYNEQRPLLHGGKRF